MMNATAHHPTFVNQVTAPLSQTINVKSESPLLMFDGKRFEGTLSNMVCSLSLQI